MAYQRVSSRTLEHHSHTWKLNGFSHYAISFIQSKLPSNWHSSKTTKGRPIHHGTRYPVPEIQRPGDPIYQLLPLAPTGSNPSRYKSTKRHPLGPTFGGRPLPPHQQHLPTTSNKPRPALRPHMEDLAARQPPLEPIQRLSLMHI